MSNASATSKTEPVRIVSPKRAPPLLLCRKCLKRADSGVQIKQALARETKRTGKALGRKRKLILTGCFGICPKRAVVVASGATLNQNEYLLLTRAEDAAAAVSRLTMDR